MGRAEISEKVFEMTGSSQVPGGIPSAFSDYRKHVQALQTHLVDLKCLPPAWHDPLQVTQPSGQPTCFADLEPQYFKARKIDDFTSWFASELSSDPED